MAGGRRMRRHYPCRMVPGNPTLHVWRAAGGCGEGWFACDGCGAAGACVGCLARREMKPPADAIPVWCERHHAILCGKRLPLSGTASLAI